MSSAVLDALKVQEGLTRKRSRYVFCNREGGRLTTIKTAWATASETAGIAAPSARTGTGCAVRVTTGAGRCFPIRSPGSTSPPTAASTARDPSTAGCA
jgi:hypothetical protein